MFVQVFTWITFASVTVASFPAECFQGKLYLRWILGIYVFLISSNIAVWYWALSQ
jgi:hypothetical protein